MSEQVGSDARQAVVQFDLLTESRHPNSERAMKIEPTSEAWEASVLPLNYARSLITILLRIDPPHGVRRKNWINGVWHFYG